MKKSSVSWSVKQWNKMFNNGKISFDYPIQRQGNQWDLFQKSLLIHSLAGDYPVPPFYSIKEGEVYFILDGKQRLTNIIEFVNNVYPLHVDTPPVTIEGKEYQIAESTFEELHEEVQDSIYDFMLNNYKLDEATDEEIEDLFFRLNNGTPLTKQQKAKAKMGTEWAHKFKEVLEHPFMVNKAAFSKAQIRKADNETAILQTMMLIDQAHDLKSISSNHVFEYTQKFKEDAENKELLLNDIVKVLDYLDQAYGEKESVLAKKVNFPMLLITAKQAMDKDITVLEFKHWTDEFKNSLKGKGEIETSYKEFGGAGSVKREKTLGRIREMERHFDEYFAVNVS
ncbi:DUF262 domain-containing protein [Cytobacillus oceanisediminis]|uniref:DUF262 domain-containing protein n=1 Tax=Cytobacillus oceanisediminis TaxID=665099 RepID=UPI001C226207|nr:DUF262 domain-containing protein [Cytobacillus oceanisediminis]MBU8732556.1 DUF262 domain-containing protein [Cytobacillus oceanisediminis]